MVVRVVIVSNFVVDRSKVRLNREESAKTKPGRKQVESVIEMEWPVRSCVTKEAQSVCVWGMKSALCQSGLVVGQRVVDVAVQGLHREMRRGLLELMAREAGVWSGRAVSDIRDGFAGREMGIRDVEGRRRDYFLDFKRRRS